jgi:hypothetical protein
MLCEITTPLIESWLDDKALSRRVGEGEQARTLPGLSWAARTDLRNILSGIFTKAEDWGFWNDRNPVERVTGRTPGFRSRKAQADRGSASSDSIRAARRRVPNHRDGALLPAANLGGASSPCLNRPV